MTRPVLTRKDRKKSVLTVIVYRWVFGLRIRRRALRVALTRSFSRRGRWLS